MAAIFTKWFPSGFRLIDGNKLSSWFNNPQASYENNITAKAGGGQTNAYQLSAIVSRISVCASANDSVKLPNTSNTVGSVYWVINDGAQNLTVFSFSVATIDGIAGNVGVVITAGKRAAFIGTKSSPNGTWASMGGSKTT